MSGRDVLHRPVARRLVLRQLWPGRIAAFALAATIAVTRLLA